MSGTEPGHVVSSNQPAHRLHPGVLARDRPGQLEGWKGELDCGEKGREKERTEI